MRGWSPDRASARPHESVIPDPRTRGAIPAQRSRPGSRAEGCPEAPRVRRRRRGYRRGHTTVAPHDGRRAGPQLTTHAQVGGSGIGGTSRFPR
ncbi:hypothetical protein GA0115234_10771 [Streptomyces sp. DvalAA-43]|nr:hypothetical protein GA0115234_10771 [Streptomyces sp. DvalAA-43]